MNVPWDGGVHAFILDTIVSPAGCEWLHVDFDDHLRPFSFDACGFASTNGGLINLKVA